LVEYTVPGEAVSSLLTGKNSAKSPTLFVAIGFPTHAMADLDRDFVPSRSIALLH